MDKAKIRAEIAAKKERLAELKARRKNAKDAGGGRAPRAARGKRQPRQPRQPRNTDALAGLDSLIGPTTTVRKDSSGPTLTVSSPDNVNINIDTVVPETYNKAIDCAIIGGTDDEKRNAEMQQELQQQSTHLKEEEEKLEKFKEQLRKDRLKYDKVSDNDRVFEKKELDPVEVRRIETEQGFQNFFGKASKVVERALNFTYDFTTDYFADTGNAEQSADEKLVRKGKLWDEKKTGNRAITSISWGAKNSGYLLTTYAGQDDAMSLEADGTVMLWNTSNLNRAENNFYCNSAVLTASFHPTNPSLIVGGCRSGQVVVWDTRLKRTPIDRTSLSRGHTYPVYALRALPEVNDQYLISVSTDGQLCQWSDGNLHDPAIEIDLNVSFKESEGKESTTDEITTTSFDYPGEKADYVILGSDEGKVYKATAAKGISGVLDAHDAPISNVQFHPNIEGSPHLVSDLFLTSSYDWTVKLWSYAQKNRALYTFECARDYVFDVQWSPVHPAVFASGDGTGKLDVWNLTNDTDVPIYSIQVEKDKGAISKIKWSPDGTILAVGMSTGAVHVFDVKEELYSASNEDSGIFYSKMEAETKRVEDGL